MEGRKLSYFGGRGFTAATPTGMTAIVLFPVGSMPVAHQGIASAVGTMKGDCHHSPLVHLELVLTVYHILLTYAITKKVYSRPHKCEGM